MAKKQDMQVSADEQIGFHKGALSTLAKEREEMIKILSIVEQLMQAHLKGLKDLGIDLEAEAKKAMEELNGKELDGRALKVDVAVEKKDDRRERR